MTEKNENIVPEQHPQVLSEHARLQQAELFAEQVGFGATAKDVVKYLPETKATPSEMLTALVHVAYDRVVDDPYRLRDVWKKFPGIRSQMEELHEQKIAEQEAFFEGVRQVVFKRSNKGDEPITYTDGKVTFLPKRTEALYSSAIPEDQRRLPLADQREAWGVRVLEEKERVNIAQLIRSPEQIAYRDNVEKVEERIAAIKTDERRQQEKRQKEEEIEALLPLIASDIGCEVSQEDLEQYRHYMHGDARILRYFSGEEYDRESVTADILKIVYRGKLSDELIEGIGQRHSEAVVRELRRAKTEQDLDELFARRLEKGFERILQRVHDSGMHEYTIEDIKERRLGNSFWQTEGKRGYAASRFVPLHPEDLSDEEKQSLEQHIFQQMPYEQRITLQRGIWYGEDKERDENDMSKYYDYMHQTVDKGYKKVVIGYEPIYKEGAEISDGIHLPTGLSVDEVNRRIDYKNNTIRFSAIHSFSEYASDGDFTFAHPHEGERGGFLDYPVKLLSWEVPLHPQDNPEVLDEEVTVKKLYISGKRVSSSSQFILEDKEGKKIARWNKVKRQWVKGYLAKNQEELVSSNTAYLTFSEGLSLEKTIDALAKEVPPSARKERKDELLDTFSYQGLKDISHTIEE